MTFGDSALRLDRRALNKMGAMQIKTKMMPKRKLKQRMTNRWESK